MVPTRTNPADTSAGASAAAALPPHGLGEAAALWAELGTSVLQRLDAFTAASPAERAPAQRRLMLALELRWKLADLVLLPALQDADSQVWREMLRVEQEIELLRDLAQLVKEGQLLPAAASIVLAALEGIAMLSAQRIDSALAVAEQAGQIDSPALAQEMQALLSRWRAEVRATGDIEDEELDPVGKPPR